MAITFLDYYWFFFSEFSLNNLRGFWGKMVDSWLIHHLKRNAFFVKITVLRLRSWFLVCRWPWTSRSSMNSSEFSLSSFKEFWDNLADCWLVNHLNSNQPFKSCQNDSFKVTALIFSLCRWSWPSRLSVIFS